MRWFICSDIHIGLNSSKEEYFYQIFIPQLKMGDVLLLLGDIFDYWLSSTEEGVKQLEAGWITFTDELRILRDKDIRIIYVPGNHDSFVFYNEWSIFNQVPPWLTQIFDKQSILSKVRA